MGWTLDWAHGRIEVRALGAMMGPVVFRLPNGREVSPLHVAPWEGEPGTEHLPGILRALRGEWPCVPFGAERNLELTGDWMSFSGAAPEQPLPAHGESSNCPWHCEEEGTMGLRLALDLAPGSPIARLERTIQPDLSGPAVDLTLTIHPRQDVTWPLGLHPVFRVPDSGIIIEAAGSDGGVTFPGSVEPGISSLAPAVRFTALTSVPLTAGGSADLSRLPLPRTTEELVQLLGAGGWAAVTYPAEKFRAVLNWQAEHLPDLILWISNRGRSAFPWLGRHQALGLEPVCAAFDLGPRVSADHNPLSAMGRVTAIKLRAGEPFTTRYRLSVEPI